FPWESEFAGMRTLASLLTISIFCQFISIGTPKSAVAIALVYAPLVRLKLIILLPGSVSPEDGFLISCLGTKLLPLLRLPHPSKHKNSPKLIVPIVFFILLFILDKLLCKCFIISFSILILVSLILQARFQTFTTCERLQKIII